MFRQSDNPATNRTVLGVLDRPATSMNWLPIVLFRGEFRTRGTKKRRVTRDFYPWSLSPASAESQLGRTQRTLLLMASPTCAVAPAPHQLGSILRADSPIGVHRLPHPFQKLLGSYRSSLDIVVVFPKSTSVGAFGSLNGRSQRLGRPRRFVVRLSPMEAIAVAVLVRDMFTCPLCKRIVVEKGQLGLRSCRATHGNEQKFGQGRFERSASLPV